MIWAAILAVVYRRQSCNLDFGTTKGIIVKWQIADEYQGHKERKEYFIWVTGAMVVERRAHVDKLQSLRANFEVGIVKFAILQQRMVEQLNSRYK